MRVLISMLEQAGHIWPTIPLARALAARGHQVTYGGLPEGRRWLERSGFPFRPLVPPRELRQDLPRGRRCAALARERRDRWFRFLRGPALTAWLATDTDLVLGDVLLTPRLLAAVHRGLPTVALCSSLPPFREPGRPPLTTALAPSLSHLARAPQLRAWLSEMAHNRRDAHHGHDLTRAQYRALARGLPLVRGCFRRRLVDWLPQLVLCPAVFDTGAALPTTARRRYLSLSGPPAVTEDRPALLQTLAADRPLIYCSFGSLPQRYAGFNAAVEALGHMMRTRPAWQAVLVTGEQTPPACDRLPPNVLRAPWLPQRRLLARAQLAVHHGGLGTIKECIEARVPMVVLPQAFDQPGNAVRVAQHGIGAALHGPRRYPALLRVSEALLHAEPPRRRLELLARAVLAEQRVDCTVRWLERLVDVAPGRRPD